MWYILYRCTTWYIQSYLGKAAHENARLYPPFRPRLYRLDSRFGLLCLSRSFRSRDYEPALLDQLLHLASSERGPLHHYSQTASRPTHRMGVRNAPARYSWDDWRGSRSLSSIDIHAKDSRLIGRPLRRFSICYICACAWDRGDGHVEGNPVTALAEVKTTTQRIASSRMTGKPHLTACFSDWSRHAASDSGIWQSRPLRIK